MMWSILKSIKATYIVLLITSKESNSLSFDDPIHNFCNDSIKPLSESTVDLILENITSHLDDQYYCKTTKTGYHDFSICINKTVSIFSTHQFHDIIVCIVFN